LYICDYSGGEVFKIVPRTTPPPSLVITQQPAPAMACVGNTVSLSVTATSIGSPAAYQWRLGATPLVDGTRPSGAVISGSGAATLMISNIRPDEAGLYTCLVSNACRNLPSNSAPVSVNSADFDNDGDAGTDADIEAFFACLAGNCCPACGSADFNADGDVGTDADIESFFRVLAGQAC
jgi:hypothetical protein